jgi:hypothetical protein
MQNPSTPYGWWLLPPSSEKEKTYSDWAWPSAGHPDLSAAWRLEASEAVVLLGRTPPKCKYFSFSNYLFSRSYPAGWKPTIEEFDKCSDGPTRCELGASLIDSANHHRMNLSSGTFDAPFAVVLSASRSAMAAAVQELRKSGVPACSITEYPFPGEVLKLGLDEDSDSMANWMRMAFFEDEAAKKKYIDEVPLRIFRLKLWSAHDSLATLFPSFENRLISRYSGTDDGTPLQMSMSAVSESLDKLQQAIVEEYKPLTVGVTEMTAGVPVSGYECIESGKRCQVDCMDTYYPASMNLLTHELECEQQQQETDDCSAEKRSLLSQDDNDFYIVIGVNHAKAGMSSYSSVSVYDYTKASGIKGITDDVLNNTALTFVNEAEDPYAPYLYAYKFMRKCPEKDRDWCYDVPVSGNVLLPLESPLMFIERSYDNPVTHTGPDGYGVSGGEKAMTNPRVLHFR